MQIKLKKILKKKVFYNHFADMSDSNKLNHSANLINIDKKKLQNIYILILINIVNG